MKIGASTLSGFKDDLESNLDYFEQLGLKYAEIVHQYPNDEINTDVLDSYNLKYSVHSPLMGINIGSLNKGIREASINEIKKSIDLASEINADIVVVHPGMVPFLGRGFEEEIYRLAHEAFKELGQYGQDLGVTAAIENMPNFEGHIYKNMVDLNNILEELDMYMTLDIGHAYHSGYSAEDMYFDRVKHIHIHDNNGNDDSHMALGEGSIDLKKVISQYEDNNYKGIYTIEVNDKESVKKSLSYLKK